MIIPSEHLVTHATQRRDVDPGHERGAKIDANAIGLPMVQSCREALPTEDATYQASWLEPPSPESPDPRGEK